MVGAGVGAVAGASAWEVHASGEAASCIAVHACIVGGGLGVGDHESHARARADVSQVVREARRNASCFEIQIAVACVASLIYTPGEG